ncbi:BMP family ABC transporter substrate-binding protein [Proteiniclasticum sp. QWL-01]|uniref:BMP family ABC transporter substrate-binding protein n=1 Tax=Proteiniclasticum sp. QWL-01 TaxID=3036945 RepID=UPI002207302B|nr:BMP family ABC transporter substrate-binding protein [Proteiniclasticum sp. QWL-01]UUM12910.1 BMP family ABC transporter substrate-binding protein [Clostridiaceae bacterium HFYG-1003]WFF74456.1 BMP family ABC transporter substrate-binding protein [Proteiniclasticum sp. QWL-01]
MKKKLMSILTTSVLAIGLVAGCTPTTPTTTAGGTTPGTTAAGTTTAGTSAETTPATTTASGEKLKVTLIVGGNLGDKSFNDSAWAGLKKAEAELGTEVKVIELGGDPSKQEPTVRDVADDGTDIIMVASGGLIEAVQLVAPEYPDVKFVSFDVSPSYAVENDNLYGIIFKQNEADFLAGAIAGKMSKSGVIGFVGGQENPIINDFLVGYIDGAKQANPAIKVAVSFVGNWTDSAKGKEMSFAQVLLGADVLHGVAGGAGLGVIEAAAEKKLWAIGVDSDQTLMFEGDSAKANAIVTSALKNVGDTLYLVIKKHQEGSLNWGKLESFGIKEGAVGLARNDNYKKNVPAEVQTWVDELENKVKNGEYTVPSAFTMTNEQFVELKNSIKP